MIQNINHKIGLLHVENNDQSKRNGMNKKMQVNLEDQYKLSYR